MIVSALVLAVGFYLASLLVFFTCLQRAPQGYEDGSGFHFGLLPQRFIFARRRPARRMSVNHRF